MKKYEELAKINREYVEELRRRKAALRNAKQQIQRVIDSSDDIAAPDRDIIDRLDDAADLELNLLKEIVELEDAIKQEYEDAPFAATRQAGISGFWREVGGRL